MAYTFYLSEQNKYLQWKEEKWIRPMKHGFIFVNVEILTKGGEYIYGIFVNFIFAHFMLILSRLRTGYSLIITEQSFRFVRFIFKGIK